MAQIFAFMTGTKVVFHGEDDYSEEHGWIDPAWSMTVLHESRNDVRPEISEDSDSEELTDRIFDLVGGPDWSDNGDGTFYGQGEATLVDNGDGTYSDWTYAVHFIHKTVVDGQGVETEWSPSEHGIDLGSLVSK